MRTLQDPSVEYLRYLTKLLANIVKTMSVYLANFVASDTIKKSWCQLIDQNTVCFLFAHNSIELAKPKMSDQKSVII